MKLLKIGRKAYHVWTKNKIGRKLGLVSDEGITLKGKMRTGSAAVLAIGLIAELLGISLATTQIDALVTAGAVLGVAYGQWRANRNYNLDE